MGGTSYPENKSLVFCIELQDQKILWMWDKSHLQVHVRWKMMKVVVKSFNIEKYKTFLQPLLWVLYTEDGGGRGFFFE